MIQVCASPPALVAWQDGLAAQSERSVRAFPLPALPAPHPRLALAFGHAFLRPPPDSEIEAVERDTNSEEEGGDKESVRSCRSIAPEGREVRMKALLRRSRY